MKTLKVLFILFMLTSFFTACSKSDNAGPEPAPEEENPDQEPLFTKEEIKDYYFVCERKTGNKLALLQFFDQDNSIKASMHLKGSLRVNDINISGSTMTFDFNNDAKTIYTFTFERDDAGKLQLKSYQLISQSDANQGLDYALMVPKSAAFPFENLSFKTTDDILFRFKSTDNTKKLEWNITNELVGYTTLPGGIKIPRFEEHIEKTVDYYLLDNGGWKASNDSFFGICVPKWKDSESPQLLVQNESTVVSATRSE